MTMVGPVGVGIIGAGMISEFYLENLTRFPDTNVLAIADIDLARAQASADKWRLPHAGTTEDRHIRTGGSHIATGELGLHVLDTLIAVEESALRGEFVPIESTVASLGSLPEAFGPFEATL